MDFDDLETAEVEDAAEIIPPRQYFEVPDDEEKDDDQDDKVEATVEGLAKALMEERKQRRQLERQLTKMSKQLEGMKTRVDKAPGLWQLGRRTPEIHPTAWVAPGAVIIGTVKMLRDSSVWFNCTIRGDNELITIGEGTDIQDNSILHCDPGKPINIGKEVLVGHQVCLHGCTIGNNCLIGMRTTMLDGSKVGSNCLVAAGSFIGENKTFPDNSVIGGNPAKKIADIEGAHLEMAKHAWETYVDNKDRFSKQLRPY